ncbi:MAG: hypothetical protein HOP36_02095 [Methyloglobulus sp.]|nr:hypothetical protein [Methyloglobulus sp.]
MLKALAKLPNKAWHKFIWSKENKPHGGLPKLRQVAVSTEQAAGVRFAKASVQEATAKPAGGTTC